MNLEDKEVKFLSLVDAGKFLMRVNSIGRPFALQCEYHERESLASDEIERHNERVMDLIATKSHIAEIMAKKSGEWVATVKKSATAARRTITTLAQKVKNSRGLKLLREKVTAARERSALRKEIRKRFFEVIQEQVDATNEPEEKKKEIRERATKIARDLTSYRVQRWSDREKEDLLRETYDLSGEQANDLVELEKLIAKLVENERKEKLKKKSAGEPEPELNESDKERKEEDKTKKEQENEGEPKR